MSKTTKVVAARRQCELANRALSAPPEPKNEAEPLREIWERLDTTDRCVSYVEEMTALLEDRLRGVMRSDEKPAPQEAHSPSETMLGQRIEEIATRIRNAGHRIEHLVSHSGV